MGRHYRQSDHGLWWLRAISLTPVKCSPPSIARWLKLVRRSSSFWPSWKRCFDGPVFVPRSFVYTVVCVGVKGERLYIGAYTITPTHNRGGLTPIIHQITPQYDDLEEKDVSELYISPTWLINPASRHSRTRFLAASIFRPRTAMIASQSAL